MKLAEILAEVMEEWPSTTRYYAQDCTGAIYPWVDKPRLTEGDWEIDHCSGNGIDHSTEAFTYNLDLASDWDEALVTKEMWLAEKERKGGDGTQTNSTGGGTSGHIHAESMKLYAEDAAETEKPWERWQTRMEGERNWIPLAVSPAWCLDQEYRRKPTTIKLGGEEVPEPVKEPLKWGTVYWLPRLHTTIEVAKSAAWHGVEVDQMRLKRGLVHLNKEDAVAHAKALIKVSGGEV